uniref:CHK domain-containing protein n=1 Tax=Rhabditophanes sp. KR3021 TaxID=114890 RepID=A0AC35TT31_9BILA
MTKETLTTRHNREIACYKLFKEDLNLIEMYGCQKKILHQQEGAIILKYLDNKYTHVSYFGSFNATQIENVVERILKLQIASFKTRKQWDGKCDSLFTKQQFAAKQSMFGSVWETMYSYASYAYCGSISRQVYALHKKWEQMYFEDLEKVLSENEGETVLGHNNLSVNSVVFDENEPVISDWQQMTEVNNGSDLASLMVKCVDTDTRHEIEQYIFPLFYSRLKEGLKNDGYELKMTFEDFKYNYDVSFINQTIFYLMDHGFALKEYKIPDKNGDAYFDEIKRKYALKIYHLFKDCLEIKTELEGKNFKESNTSLAWLVDCLEKNSEEFNKLRGNSKVSDIDGYDLSDGKDSFVCILKVPTSESMNAAIDPEIMASMTDAIDANLLARVHNNEILFYTQFKDQKDLKLVEIYGYRERVVDGDDGALLMKYLGNDVVHIHVLDSLNLEQTLKLFDQILVLQTISLKDRCKWKGFIK